MTLPHMLSEQMDRTVPSPSASAQADVVFRTPTGTRVLGALMRVALSALVTLLVFAAFGYALSGNASRPPIAIIIASCAVPPLFAVAVYALFTRRQPTRLSLGERGIRIGGRFLGRDISYEDLLLVKIERPEKTVGNSALLLLRATRGPLIKIWLAGNDANDCFHALRSMSEHAAAIGISGETYLPGDPAFTDAGRRSLAAEHERKARRALAGAVFTAVVGALAIFGIMFGRASVSGQSRAWMAAVVMPLVCASWIGVYFNHRKRAMAMREGPGATELE